MQNIDDKIAELENIIKYRKSLMAKLSNLEEIKIDDSDPLDIAILEYKLMKLKGIKANQGVYVETKPEYGDKRYTHFGYKNALDILRVLYYDYFKKDPSISVVINDNYMFGDSTLYIPVDTFLIRGEIPFKIMLQKDYKNYKPDDHYGIGISFSQEKLAKMNGEQYLMFMIELIKKYSDNEINFICGDGYNNKYTLAYIGDESISYLGTQKYYEFFKLLCDNNYRNIIYIGDAFKKHGSFDEITQVNSEFVISHIKWIAKNLGISQEQLIKSNEKIKNHILKLSRNNK